MATPNKRWEVDSSAASPAAGGLAAAVSDMVEGMPEAELEVDRSRDWCGKGSTCDALRQPERQATLLSPIEHDSE